MASNSSTDFIHPTNLVVAKHVEEKLQSDDRYETSLKYPSIYAPMHRMTYSNHTLYAVLGQSGSGFPVPAETSADKLHAASDGLDIAVIDSEGSYELVGDKLNGPETSLSTSNPLARGLPPFPSVQFGAQTLSEMEEFQADPDLLAFRNCEDGIMSKMCDFRTGEDRQVQWLIHPNAVIYHTRELLSAPLIQIGGDDPDAKEKTIVKLKNIYACAVAMVIAVRDEDQFFQEAMSARFRKGMIQNRCDFILTDKDAIKQVAAYRDRSDLEVSDDEKSDDEGDDDKKGEDGDSTEREGDLWFIRQLLYDWALMTCIILAAAWKELDDELELDLEWYKYQSDRPY